MEKKYYLSPIVYAIFWCCSVVWVFFFGFMLGQSKISHKDIPFLQTILPEHTTVPITENELTYSTLLKQTNDPIVVPNDADIIEKNNTTIAQKAVQEPPTSTTETGLYRFSLQLVAVQQKSSAETYVKKLQKADIPSTIIETSKNNIVWYRVYTTFEGTVEAFNAFKDKLTTLGILDTILREKTAL